MTSEQNVAAIVAQFAVAGGCAAARPFHGGHIHQSYRITCSAGDRAVEYLLQRINTAVFQRPELVMDNIRRVTGHVAHRLQEEGRAELSRCVLTLISTSAGEAFFRDADGAYWRLYEFIAGSRTVETAQTTRLAEEAGRAFGRFQMMLADWAGPRLHETIPDFHNTPRRLEALEQAIRTDAVERVATVRAEIDLIMRHRALVNVLLALHEAGQMPERIVHNDAKISNVLFDEATEEALCVVDLDTVMPGLSLYDYGDMVRSMVCPAAEDEPDLSKIRVELPLLEALARGYLDAAGAFLTSAECAHLVCAGRLITLEQAIRFLTDYLEGDHYYQTTRTGQNLDRARNQLRLFECLTRCESQLERTISRLLPRR